MNLGSALKSGASLQIRECARPTLSRHAPVLSRPTSPGHLPEKLLASRSDESPDAPSAGTPLFYFGRPVLLQEHIVYPRVDDAQGARRRGSQRRPDRALPKV